MSNSNMPSRKPTHLLCLSLSLSERRLRAQSVMRSDALAVQITLVANVTTIAGLIYAHKTAGTPPGDPASHAPPPPNPAQPFSPITPLRRESAGTSSSASTAWPT